MSNDNESAYSNSRSILNEPSIIKHNTFAFDKNGTMDRPLPVKRVPQNQRNYPPRLRERHIGPPKFVHKRANKADAVEASLKLLHKHMEEKSDHKLVTIEPINA